MRKIKKFLQPKFIFFSALFAVSALVLSAAGCSGSEFSSHDPENISDEPQWPEFPSHDPKNIPDESQRWEESKLFRIITDENSSDFLFSIISIYDSNGSFIIGWGVYPSYEFYDEAVLVGEGGELTFDDTWKPSRGYIRLLAWSPVGMAEGNTAPIYLYKLNEGKWVYVMTSTIGPDSYNKSLVEEDSEFYDLLNEFVKQHGGSAGEIRSLTPRWVVETE